MYYANLSCVLQYIPFRTIIYKTSKLILKRQLETPKKIRPKTKIEIKIVEEQKRSKRM